MKFRLLDFTHLREIQRAENQAIRFCMKKSTRRQLEIAICHLDVYLHVLCVLLASEQLAILLKNIADIKKRT